MNDVDTILVSDEILNTVKSAIQIALIYESRTLGKRKLGITGEVGEILVCYHLGLRLSVDPRSQGFDAVDKDGLRVQIKSRKSESQGMPRDAGRTTTFSKHKFDYALLGLLDDNYQLREVWRAEYDVLRPIIERNKKRNPNLSSFKKVGRKIYELVNEEKLAKAVEIEEKMKALQGELKALGIKKGWTVAVAKGCRPKSVSGKYPSVRAFVEEMFAENGKVAHEEMETAVKSEFPESKFTKADYNWYKNKIFYHGEWKTR